LHKAVLKRPAYGLFVRFALGIGVFPQGAQIFLCLLDLDYFLSLFFVFLPCVRGRDV
jgi:hypothetical protein